LRRKAFENQPAAAANFQHAQWPHRARRGRDDARIDLGSLVFRLPGGEAEIEAFRIELRDDLGTGRVRMADKPAGASSDLLQRSRKARPSLISARAGCGTGRATNSL